MAPRRRIVEPEFGDPIQGAVDQDRESVADSLLDVLETLSGVDQGSIRGILYRIPVPNGKYEWIRDVYPPFDLSEIMRSLKEDVGGGDYALRIMAEGKPRKTIHFAIMKDKNPSLLAPPPANNNQGDMVAMMGMMMNMQMEASRDARASADRQMQALIGAATVVLPLVMGGKDKTSEVMAALAPFIVQKNDDSMEKTLTMLTTAKTLFGGDGESKGDSAEDMIASGAKLIGPAMKGIAEMVSRGRGQPAALPPADGGERVAADTGALMLGAPATVAENPPGSEATHFAKHGPSKYPVLDLIRQDVLFLYGRGHDPEKAADLVYDTIDAHEVPEEDINALAAAFAISPDWLADLAAEGIDLRERPEWAQAFLGALLNIHAGLDAEDERSGGGTGGLPDAGEDGEAGEAGPARSADT